MTVLSALRRGCRFRPSVQRYLDSAVRTGSSACGNGVQISVTPAEVLIDEKLRVQVTGLQERQPITIHASLVENKAEYASCASYVADETGMVDLDVHKAIQGTYNGKEAIGLFWSMLPAPGQQKGLRLMKRDVTTPYDVTLRVYDDKIPFEALYERAPTPVASARIKRWYKAKDVARHEIRERGVVGTLFLPPGNGPFPGVIDMFGSTGGLVEYRSALLASRGFAALSLPFFSYENLPSDMRDIKFEYFTVSVNPEIDQNTII